MVSQSAFRDAELLVDAIDAALSGTLPEAQALVEYEQRRNAATRPEYERNLYLTSGKPFPPELLATRAQIRGDAEARSYFLGSEGRLG